MNRRAMGVRRCVRSHAPIYTYQRYERTRSLSLLLIRSDARNGTSAHIGAHLRKPSI